MCSRSSLVAQLNNLEGYNIADNKKRFMRAAIPIKHVDSDSPVVKLLHYGTPNKPQKCEYVAKLCDRLFDGRFTIVEVLGGKDMIIRHAGRGYEVYKPSYLNVAAGTRYEDDPDLSYGKWIAYTHFEAIRGGRPVVEQVDALIKVPRQTTKRVRYQRILMPFKTSTGRQYLATASILDPGINLRTKLA